MQVGLMKTLVHWLSEDHSRVENRLCQREAVAQLVEVYHRLTRNTSSVRSPVMPQMLDSLKAMLDRWGWGWGCFWGTGECCVRVGVGVGGSVLTKRQRGWGREGVDRAACIQDMQQLVVGRNR